MRNLFCVTCLLSMTWVYATPGSYGSGAYSYSDSSGRRVGGTYNTQDGKVVNSAGDFPPPFQGPVDQGFGYEYPGTFFFPTYFANLDNYLQETFDTNIENQQLAFNAARKAFDLTSNMAGYIPYFDRFNNFGGFGGFPNMPNSAFALARAGPGFSHQVAAINPENQNRPNINKFNRKAGQPTDGGFYSVSSKSYSSSSNVDGEEITNRGAQTIVNDNGQISEYHVES